MTDKLDYGIYYRTFNSDSDEYAKHMTANLATQIAPWLPDDKTSPALDIGCGMGFLIMALKSHGYKDVIGVDIDESQINACKSRELNAHLINDLEAYLAQHKGKFGLITMMDVLEHIPHNNQINVLKLIYTALTPNGKLILQVPNASSIVASRWQYNDFTHHLTYTEHSIRFALLNAGFNSVFVPHDTNLEPRPSLRPSKIFSAANRKQFKRWAIRRIWREVLSIEVGENQISKIPLGVNLNAIAEK
jgi:2-polyprenyl-3-methyl-5-hydroxy-6-metoxy-1,4-benzoquinol methylase